MLKCQQFWSQLSWAWKKFITSGPGPTQTGLGNHWRWLEAWNFGFRKKRDCTILVAKTKTLISFAVTAKLICVFVFAYAKIRFSHVAAHWPAASFGIVYFLWCLLLLADFSDPAINRTMSFQPLPLVSNVSFTCTFVLWAFRINLTWTHVHRDVNKSGKAESNTFVDQTAWIHRLLCYLSFAYGQSQALIKC